MMAMVVLAAALAAADATAGERRPAARSQKQQIAQVAQAAPAEPSREALERELDELFQRMLANPGDLDVALRYAQVSVQLGDFETAVMAYERLLMIDPDLPRIRYELGFLYYRLGSPELARAYLQRALASPSLPPDVRAGAQTLLAEISQQTKSSLFSGSVTGGLRYQTNANAGSASGISRSAGQDISLTSETARAADWNAFANVAVKHRYDLDTANDAAIDSDLNLYAGRQFSQEDLNLITSELRTGPRLRPFEIDPDLQVRPHYLGGATTLEDRPYSWISGIGLDLARRITEEFTLDATTDYRYRRYYNHGDDLTRVDQTGWEAGGILRARYTLSPRQQIGFDAGVRSTDTRRPHNDYYDFALSLGYLVAFDAPITFIERPWTASLAINRAWTNYQGPDPAIDPDVTRRDRQWQGSLTISAPLTEVLTAYVQTTASRYSSNLPNYAYENLSIVFGLTHGF